MTTNCDIPLNDPNAPFYALVRSLIEFATGASKAKDFCERNNRALSENLISLSQQQFLYRMWLAIREDNFQRKLARRERLEAFRDRTITILTYIITGNLLVYLGVLLGRLL